MAVGRSPALIGDRLTGQVHHPFGAGKGGIEPVVLPAGRVGRIELQAAEALTGELGEGLLPPADEGELMAQLEQIGHQLTSHEARAAQQQQAHLAAGST
ncbi:hypothetical protein SYNGFB01_09335 [Synechococcus sp. GFB01]|nr:hypothetical protein SYNGFB01_09335 [Synechococcus sp. GFB01]